MSEKDIDIISLIVCLSVCLYLCMYACMYMSISMLSAHLLGFYQGRFF